FSSRRKGSVLIPTGPLNTSHVFDFETRLRQVEDSINTCGEPESDSEDFAVTQSQIKPIIERHSPNVTVSSSSSITPIVEPYKSPLTKKQKANLRQRGKRRSKRAEEQIQAQTTLKLHVRRHCAKASHHSLRTNRDLNDGFPVTQPGWIGKRMPDGDCEHSLDDLMGKGNMTLVDWDGYTTHTITDSCGRNIGLLGGMPRQKSWEDVQKDAAAAIRNSASLLYVPEEKRHHRRGHFISIPMGLSFGGGNPQPGMLRQHNQNTPILDKLVQHPALVSIVGHTDSLFKLYAPRLHDYYKTTLNSLIAWSNNGYRRIFSNSVFAAATVNTGDRVVSVSHLDFKNLSWGWCSITALGDFDPDHGGHLVLWDLKYVIRFPPGSTILIPSALLRHSNVPIRSGEVRHSFTQYSAGGLFRFVHNNFKADNQLKKSERERLSREGAQRWKKGLEMFSTVDELL
ncbi:hypothetical protein CVT24_002742, partial [Panaeolus cyanescens]